MRPCRSLRQLVITGGLIQGELEAIRRLPGLTALRLPYCDLEGLPDGPYLSSLKRCGVHGQGRLMSLARCRKQSASKQNAAPSLPWGWHCGWPSICAAAPALHCRRSPCQPSRCSLDVSGDSQLASPIPFAATAARDLRALSISWLEHPEPQDWLDLEWKLHCFPALEVRCKAGALE